jgi:hypothetical protein
MPPDEAEPQDADLAARDAEGCREDPGQALDEARQVPAGEAPVVLWLLAALATVAALLSMSLERALPGVWLGVDHVITAVKLAGAAASQLLAVSSTAVVIGLVLATLKSRLPAHLRAYAVGAGALSVLAVMLASAMKLPEPSRLVLGGAVVLLGLLAAWPAAGVYTLRAAALVIGAVSLAGALRVVTVLVAMLSGGADTLVAAAQVGATVGMLLELVAIVLALAWLTSQPRARAGTLVPLRRPRWTLLGLVLGVSGALVGAAHLGADPEAQGFFLLVARSVEQLAVQPSPFSPTLLTNAVELLRWVVIVGLLVVAPRGRMMSSTVALALVARGTVEVPLCAAMLVVAALALGLHPGPDLRFELSARSGAGR